MKLKISNLGPIDSMVIDMSKPFILFAGDNGTGKTYAATVLYTLILDLRQYLFFNYFTSRSELPIIKRLKNGVNGSLDADTLYDLFGSFQKKYREKVFSSMNLNILSNAFKFEIITTKEEWKEELWNKSVSVLSNAIIKKANSFDYQLRYNASDVDYLSVLQTWLIISLFFDGIIGAKMFTAERSGIYTFSKELSVGRLKNPD